MKRILVCAALLVWSGMAAAVVYKWVDAQGKLQYGDRPPDGVHAEIVAMPGNHTAPSAPRPATASTTPLPKEPARQSDDGAKQAVAEDVEQAREKHCAEAQDRYKKLIEGRKLYKTGADGEREYLTSEQIDSERLNAKHDVDSFCNSAS